MNAIIENMKTRRSIRKFKGEMVPKDKIEAIIDAGLYAANGMGKQATKIIAVTNKELRDKISKINREIGGWPADFDPFYGAPVILIVIADANVVTNVYDGSLVLGNLLNAAHSLDVDSIWIHLAKEELELPEFKALLKEIGIEGDWIGVGHCALGYADGEVPQAAARKADRVYWVE